MDLTKDGPERAKVLEAAAEAHLVRHDFLRRRERCKEAFADRDRADELTRLARQTSTSAKTAVPAIPAGLGKSDGGAPAKSSPLTGPISLVNKYQEPVVILLNGRRHEVPVATTVELPGEPAGRLVYEVIAPTWGSQGLKVRSVDPGKPFTVTVFTLP